jgi:hypothetical protein
MNTSTRSEVPSDADSDKVRHANPRDQFVLQELCSNEQTPPRNPLGSHVPDEGAFETFVGGAGI